MRLQPVRYYLSGNYTDAFYWLKMALGLDMYEKAEKALKYYLKTLALDSTTSLLWQIQEDCLHRKEIIRRRSTIVIKCFKSTLLERNWVLQ